MLFQGFWGYCPVFDFYTLNPKPQTLNPKPLWSSGFRLLGVVLFRRHFKPVTWSFPRVLQGLEALCRVWMMFF